MSILGVQDVMLGQWDAIQYLKLGIDMIVSVFWDRDKQGLLFFYCLITSTREADLNPGRLQVEIWSAF